MSCEQPYTPPYMRLWVDDVLADIAELGLTDEEFGAYMKLLLVSWKGRPINADPKRNARYVSAAPKRLAELWDAFGHKWQLDGENLISRRLERERAEAAAKSQKAKDAADKRWGK